MSANAVQFAVALAFWIAFCVALIRYERTVAAKEDKQRRMAEEWPE